MPDSNTIERKTPLPPNQAISSQAEPASCRLLLGETQRWLNWQCCMLSGVEIGAVFLYPETPKQLRSLWPSHAINNELLLASALKSIAQGKQVHCQSTIDQTDQSTTIDYFSFPVVVNELCIGAVVFGFKPRPVEQMQAVKQLVEWGILWLEGNLANLLKQDLDVEKLALGAMADLLAAAPLPVTSFQMVTNLANALHVEQVAVGLRHGLGIKLHGLSHHLLFDHRTQANRLLELAMQECVEQYVENECEHIEFDSTREHGERRQGIRRQENDPQIKSNYLTIAHRNLFKSNGSDCVFSLPLKHHDKVVGCLTVSVAHVESMPVALRSDMAHIANHLGAAFVAKAEQERGLWQLLSKRLSHFFARLFGPTEWRLKLGAAVMVVAVSMLTLVSGTYTISARSQIEGSVVQMISAPFAGFIEGVEVRPGDRVEKSQVLASLQSHDLKLEQRQWQSKRDSFKKEYYRALASNDRAEVGLMKERLFQAQAQVDLFEQKLQRAQLKAPFAGVVIKGDLSRSLGQPVKRGDKLFELSPLDEFRVVINVDEMDIDSIVEGQVATLRLTGYPDAPITAKITRIVPVASAIEQGTYFRVEAQIAQTISAIQPGMQGVARIDIGQLPLYQVWGKSFYQRVRLWLWSLGL